MKNLDRIRKIIKQHEGVLAERYGVKVVAIFGSYAKGEERRASDIDLLADILHPISLLELVGAELYLGELLDAKVDLIPKRDMREELRNAILKEATAL